MPRDVVSGRRPAGPSPNDGGGQREGGPWVTAHLGKTHGSGEQIVWALRGGG